MDTDPNQFRRDHHNAIPFTLVHSTSNQAITASSLTKLNFQASDRSDWLMWESASDTRITIKVPGYYVFGTTITWASASDGYRYRTFIINNTTSFSPVRIPAQDSAEFTGWSAPQRLVPGDYVEVQVFHTSATDPLNVITPAYFFALWISPY